MPGLNINTAVVVLLAIVVLYFGQEIFIPFALAILLSFMLAPPVNWMRHLRLPRVAAVAVVVSTAVALIGGVSVLVGSQLVNLANNLPTYQKTMQQKIRSIRAAAPGGGAIDRTTEVIQALGKDLSEPAEAPAKKSRSARPGRSEEEPLPVRVVPPEPQPMDILQNVVGPALGPIGTAGLVIVFIFFVLLAPSDLRDRFIRLAGSDLHRTTEALSEAASRVSRYLLMQLVVNATYGVPLGIGLYLIGVPGAFLWALLATLLRFIPYLGPVIAAIFPLTLAFAVDPGWDMLLWTAVLVVTLELISNNVIEPWLYGSSTGMTPMAVILSAIFWTLLWGPVGLFLATPLTVCLVVMGRYVPHLAFIDVLLGSDPVLSPEERLYQRLLAGNVEEAIDIAEMEADSHSLLNFYDQIGLSALRIAENSRERGASQEDSKKVAEGMRAVVQDLQDYMANNQDESDEPRHERQWGNTPVLCIAGRGELDAAAALLLAHALKNRGVGAKIVPASAIAHDVLGELDLTGVEVVCISYLSPMPKGYARFICRRLKHRARNLKIVLGLWNLAPEAGPAEQIANVAGADAAASSLDTATRLIEDMLGQTSPPVMPPQLSAEEEAERLQALAASGALAADKRAQLDRIARNVAQAMDTPIGLVSLVDDQCQLWKGAAGLPAELEATRQTAREVSICSHVVASHTPLVVEDTERDPRFAQNPFLRQYGMRFYAGVPLLTESGHVIGSLCVIDTKPRTLSPREIKLMQVIANELMMDLSQKGKETQDEAAQTLLNQAEDTPATDMPPRAERAGWE